MTGLSVALVVPLRRSAFLSGLTSSIESAGPLDQIIFVFDGSPEEAVPHRCVLAGWSVPHTFVCTGWRRGASAARNLGLSLVGAEYVVFLDDDDEFTDAAVSFARTYLVDQSLPAVMYGNLRLMSVTGKDEGRDQVQRSAQLDTPQAYWKALSEGLSQLGSTYVRTAYLRQVGGFDEELQTWNDRDLQYRLILGDGRIVFTPRDLMRWRRGQEGSLSVLAQHEFDRFRSGYMSSFKNWPRLAFDPVFPRYGSRIPSFLACKGATFYLRGRGRGGDRISVPLALDAWGDAEREMITEWLFRGLLEVA